VPGDGDGDCDGDEDEPADDDVDGDADGESTFPTRSFYVNSHGRNIYIGRLASVHECCAAIGELDLRLLYLEASIGTIASEALATAHGAESSRAFRTLEDSRRPCTDTEAL
jgi:hypothetical protein